MDAHLAQRLARANQYVELGRWHEATGELAAVLAGEPQSVEALCLLGQCQLNLGDAHAAHRSATAAIRVAPDAEWAHRVNSVALGRMGRPREAVAAAWEAVRLAPHTAEAHGRYAAALLDLGGPPDEARAAADRAVALAPHSPRAHVVQGVVAGRQGRRREERDAYLRALELDPHHAGALSNLAALDADRGRLGGASQLVTAALRSDPHHASALAILDALGARLVRRLTVVMVLGGLLTTLLAHGQRNGDGVAWWMRALAGVAVLGAGVVVARATLRHLPAGARLHLRSLPRRLPWFDRLVGVALCVATLSMVGTAFLPDDAAVSAAVGVLVVLRLGWLAGAIGAVRWLRANARS